MMSLSEIKDLLYEVLRVFPSDYGAMRRIYMLVLMVLGFFLPTLFLFLRMSMDGPELLALFLVIAMWTFITYFFIGMYLEQRRWTRKR